MIISTKIHGGPIFSRRAFFSAIALAIFGSAIQLFSRGEPLYHLIANFLFCTPFHEYASGFYQDPEVVLPEKAEHLLVPEILASEYSYEYLRKVSEGFTKPVKIKGLFSDTKAAKNWMKPGYLKSKFGDLKVGVYSGLPENNNGNAVNSIYAHSAGEAADEIINNEKTDLRFVLPQLAHADTNGTDPVAGVKIMKELMQELETERIRPLFGTSKHKELIGQQIFLGRGLDTPGSYKGVDWHTEPGNNWFFQVAGKKRWWFMSPKDSALMIPKKITPRLIWSSDPERIKRIEHRMPLFYTDVEAGDVVFNPEWWWHKTYVYTGLSISVPVREVYLFRCLMASPLYMMQFLLNLVFELKRSSTLRSVLKSWVGLS